MGQPPAEGHDKLGIQMSEDRSVWRRESWEPSDHGGWGHQGRGAEGKKIRGWDTDPGDVQGMSGQEVFVKEMKKMSSKLGWKLTE